MTKLNEAYKEIITEKYEDLISVTIKAYDFDKMQDLVSKKLGFDINFEWKCFSCGPFN